MFMRLNFLFHDRQVHFCCIHLSPHNNAGRFRSH
jgi:hypothetical protein